MSLGTLLQTIIAVIFIYLILSLLASEIQEYIASIAEFRAKRLKESIKQFLGEDEYSEAAKAEADQKATLTDLLYEKYLISSLNQSATSIFSFIFSILSFGKINRINRKTEGPSYIEPQLFAQALLQTIQDRLDNEYKLKISDYIINPNPDRSNLSLVNKLEKRART